jgi:hypothetical protein
MMSSCGPPRVSRRHRCRLFLVIPMSASSPFASPADEFRDNPYASPMAVGGTPSTEVEVIRMEHLSHEASIRSIGSLHYLGAILALLIWLPAVLVLFFTVGAIGAPEVLLLALVLGFVVLNVAIGRGLRRLHRGARVGAALFAVLGLLALPIGTLISGYILYLLFSPKGNRIFSEEYQEVVRQTPDMVYRTSAGLMAFAILLVLLGLAGFLGIFWVG